MSTARFDQVNIVVADPTAAVGFLRTLGLEIEAWMPEWDRHHRNLPVAGDFDADIDSPEFARHWGGLPEGFTGVVITLRTADREEVDSLYARALDAGAEGLKPPYDAFFGSRFALVMAPGPIAVGFKSARDPSRQSPPPAVDEFA